MELLHLHYPFFPGLLPYTIYPESWALNKNNSYSDMSLTAGDGKTHRWYGYRNSTLKPTFPFGAGHYYTTFDLKVKPLMADLHNSPPSFGPTSTAPFADPSAVVAGYTVTYVNTGKRPSRCRVILFAKVLEIDDKAVPLPLPVQQIVTFGGAQVLAPGDSSMETFQVTLGSLSLTDWRGRRAAYKGRYAILFNQGNGTVVTETVEIKSTVVLDQLPTPRYP
jgi:hypothetical protein